LVRLKKVPKKPHAAVVKSVRDLAIAAKRQAREILDEARQVRQTVARSRRTLSKMLGGDHRQSSGRDPRPKRKRAPPR